MNFYGWSEDGHLGYSIHLKWTKRLIQGVPVRKPPSWPDSIWFGWPFHGKIPVFCVEDIFFKWPEPLLTLQFFVFLTYQQHLIPWIDAIYKILLGQPLLALFFIPLLCRWHTAVPYISFQLTFRFGQVLRLSLIISAWMQDHIHDANSWSQECWLMIYYFFSWTCILSLQVLKCCLLQHQKKNQAVPYPPCHPAAGTSHDDLLHRPLQGHCCFVWRTSAIVCGEAASGGPAGL